MTKKSGEETQQPKQIKLMKRLTRSRATVKGLSVTGAAVTDIWRRHAAHRHPLKEILKAKAKEAVTVTEVKGEKVTPKKPENVTTASRRSTFPKTAGRKVVARRRAKELME